MRDFTFTREEYARWPEETKVLFDFHDERGEAFEVYPLVVECALMEKSERCSPYRMTSVFDASYRAWSSPPQPRLFDERKFSHEDIWAALNMSPHHCPMFGLEHYLMVQTEVPVHDNEVRWTTRFEWTALAPVLRAAWDRALLDLAVYGHTAFEERQDGAAVRDVVRDPRRILRIYGVDMGARDGIVIDEYSPPKKARQEPKRDPSPKSKVPRVVRENQPRLDGRRR